MDRVFVELAGTPGSGKTTLMRHLHASLTAQSMPCFAYEERALGNPLRQAKRDWKFNAWNMIETVRVLLEAREPGVHILERALLDARAWFTFMASMHQLGSEDRKRLSEFTRVSAWAALPTITVVLTCDLQTARRRRSQPPNSTVVNAEWYPRLRDAYQLEMDNMTDSRLLHFDTSSSDPEGDRAIFAQVHGSVSALLSEIYLEMRRQTIEPHRTE